MGDNTWVPLGSGYGQVKGVLAWASCWAAFVGRLGGPQRVRGVKGGTSWAEQTGLQGLLPFPFLFLFVSLFFLLLQFKFS